MDQQMAGSKADWPEAFPVHICVSTLPYPTPGKDDVSVPVHTWPAARVPTLMRIWSWNGLLSELPAVALSYLFKRKQEVKEVLIEALLEVRGHFHPHLQVDKVTPSLQ